MTTLSPAEKDALTRELINPLDNPFLTALIRNIVYQAVTLADVHYALSACSQALKVANGKVAERMGK